MEWGGKPLLFFGAMLAAAAALYIRTFRKNLLSLYQKETKRKDMKIRVLSCIRLDSYLCKNGMEYKYEEGYDTMSDEEFREYNEKLECGWSFDSWDEFVRNFNADTNYAPLPSEHLIRVFPDD